MIMFILGTHAPPPHTHTSYIRNIAQSAVLEASADMLKDAFMFGACFGVGSMLVSGW